MDIVAHHSRSTSDDGTTTSNAHSNADPAYSIVQSVITMISEEWSERKERRGTKVVDYLEPAALRLDLEASTSLSMSIGGAGLDGTAEGADQISSALKRFRALSVDTSHPYFFNQVGQREGGREGGTDALSVVCSSSCCVRSCP